MHGRGALLAVCLLLVAPTHGSAETTNSFAAPLDLSGAAVQATAECGRDANGIPVETPFCTLASTCDICNVSESERSYPARAAVDGDVATAWQSPPLSQGEEFRAVNFTLDLGQRFTVTSFTLRSGASPLPAVWTLHGSRDGITFTPWRTFEAGDAPQGREVTVDLSQDSPQAVATHILLELQQARAVQDANDTRQQFYSISELSVVGVCAEVTGCPECGYCLEQLTVQITNLTELINVTLIQLPEPTLVIDMTTLNTLRENISRVQSDVEHLEGTLLVLEVAVGTRNQLPDNTTLPASVVRLDLELVPPLLQKLEQLRQLVDRTQEFSFDTSTLMSILDDVQTLLSESILNATNLDTRVTTYLRTLESSLERLRRNLNETREARLEAQSIHTTVLGRQYDNITQDLNMVTGDTNTVLSMGEVFLDQAERNSREAMDIDDGLDRVEPGLGDVTEAARGALDEAATAQNNSQRVDELIQEIQELLAMAESLNRSVGGTVEEIQRLVESGEQLLQRASELTESTRTSLSTLTSLHRMLSNEVEQYRNALSPYRIPSSCNTTCTAGEIHAEELFRNLSEIRDSSVTTYTLRYARDFLARLNLTGQLFNYSAINQTVLQAQNVSRTALGRLETLDLPLLLNSTSRALSEAQSLRNRSPDILAQAEDATNLVNTTVERYEELYSDFQMLRESAEGTRRDAQNLQRQTGLRSDAEQLATVSRMAQNLTTDVGERVGAIEGEMGEVRRRVEGTAENVARTDDALNETEVAFPTIRIFLSATREIADGLARNITNFLRENDRIVTNIDSLINSLEETHSLINRINSPVRLASEPGVNRPYISLQPPPGRRLTDTIQFESLDLYLWPRGQEVRYAPPALLFYAGPVYYPGRDEGNATGVREDYLMLTAEDPTGIRLQWQLGENRGDEEIEERIQDFHAIYIVRVGSQFQFYFRSGPTYGNPSLETTVQNDSLLFHTSNRTAFLLGGWPEGAQLGTPSLPLQLQYNPFFGQFQLLLFNGQQWGLWNIRGASSSDFIGANEFRRSSLASANIWNSPSISFNGNGYLKVEQLANLPDFTSNIRTLQISIRPNDISDGLMLYAYDTTLQLSLEVAFQNGVLHLFIRQHRNPFRTFNYTTEPWTDTSSNRDVDLRIDYAQDSNLLQLQGSDVRPYPIDTYFNNLTQVQAWYGGVQEAMLEGPYVPEITNRSFVGCIDVAAQARRPLQTVFTRPFFEEQYLNSTVQRGLSATCLSTVYARNLGLDGGTNGYLSYTHFRSEGPADMSYTMNVISLSFFPVNQTGVVLAALNGENRVYVVMREEVLEVGLKLGPGADPTILRSQGNVTVGEWHYLLVGFNSPSTDDYTLYLDGIEQQSARLLRFSFQLPTVRGGTDQAVLFLGGVDRETSGFQEIQDVPTFRGCLKDFGYNYRAMSFLNEALSSNRRNVVGVTYSSCPFVTTPRVPILAVRPNQPDQRGCLPQAPTQLQNTLGGFHRETQLNTSNVLGLFVRSWTLSMQLKYTEGGQVVRVGSQQGHLIFLSVDEGRVGLSLVGQNGTREEVTHTQQLPRNVFTSVSVTCVVGGGTLSCSLSVENSPSPEMTELPYSGNLFFPTLPLVFGRTRNSSGSNVGSFVGCLRELTINGDSSGFINPVVSTGIPCYNNTEPGLGFTGTTVLGEALPPVNSSQNNTITVNFKPRRENGLLLLLTQDSDPVFAVGIFNGEVRLSNFSSPGQFGTLPEVVCDANSHNLVATYDASSISVAVDSGASLVTTLSPNLEGRSLTLTLGNTPSNFAIPEDSELFSFLLSGDGNMSLDSQPPGFVGCVMGRQVPADVVEVENLLNGFCPISD